VGRAGGRIDLSAAAEVAAKNLADREFVAFQGMYSRFRSLRIASILSTAWECFITHRIVKRR